MKLILTIDIDEAVVSPAIMGLISQDLGQCQKAFDEQDTPGVTAKLEIIKDQKTRRIAKHRFNGCNDVCITCGGYRTNGDHY